MGAGSYSYLSINVKDYSLFYSVLNSNFFPKNQLFFIFVLKHAISDLIGALCIYLSFFKKLSPPLKTVKIQISWFPKKPADPEPHCFP